jgi:D-tyrosyl-tRNA(Tyr) deacylase
MIALLQRVVEASVWIEGKIVGSIGTGLLALIAVRPTDTVESASGLLQRMLRYRIFADPSGKMNLSLTDVQGGLLLVPQFTLAADTDKGLRPGFSHAADPALGRQLFEGLLREAQLHHSPVASGCFGAHMQVTLTNDGPVTIWLES